MRTNFFTINLTWKRSVALSLFFSTLLFQLRAQTVGDYYGFTSTAGIFSPAPGAHVLGLPTQDDDTYGGISLGFNFIYKGTTYTQVSFATNGYAIMGGSINNSYSIISDQNQDNAIAPFSRDLLGNGASQLSWDTVGVAPNRMMILQWLNFQKYSSTYGAGDSYNFQLILHEGTNVIEFSYGTMTNNANSDVVEVGLVGLANGIDFANRTTAISSDWNLTDPGSSVNDQMDITSTIAPASGLTYIWTPIPMSYSSSVVSNATSHSTSPGATLQQIVKLNVRVDGFVNYIPATSMNVSTNGTTSLSDISNLSVYYTGNSSVFSAATQFGTTVVTPVLNNTITDSINLVHGDNYFWVTYDIPASATLGNVVDAEITTVTVGNVARTPSVTAPAGNRAITTPMTYVSSTTMQATTDRVAQGSTDNAVIKAIIVTSSTGAPVSVTQLDFTANGTTDTADIQNIRVYSTGNSDVFSTAIQFGSTLPSLPGAMNFSVTGITSLENDTNYFWLTYDINGGAAVTNVVDGEFTSATVDGAPQIPTVTSPAGSREIRQEYCQNFITAPQDACNFGYFINGVTTTGAVTNINNPTACSPSSTGVYRYNSNPLVVNQAQTVTMTVSGNLQWIGYSAWIDYNQDGVFDPSENVMMSPNGAYSYTASFTVPCSALPGNTIMRVITEDYPVPVTSPCASPYFGEVEEYPVTIQYAPVTYTSSTAVQQPGIVAPGTIDKPILRIPVRTDGCGTPVATEFFFNTAGSTAAADIASAKLYATGNNPVFSTSRLLGTVSAPSGAFNFIVTDTMLNNDTTNYWLAYDVSASATLGNVVDARADSLTAVGGTYIPTVTNPAGSSQIVAPMTYISSTTVQSVFDRVAQGAQNSEILKVMVVTSHTGAPVVMSQMDFTANGTTDTADIENISVYYTGNSSTLSTTTQFGSTLPVLPGTINFSVTGSQFLTNDTNYFWLTYGIRSGATLTNVVDGECTSVVVAGTPDVPTVTNPAGNREIRQEYCQLFVGTPFDACNSGYYISSVITTGATTNLNNFSGCSPSPTGSYMYTGVPLVVNQAQTVTMTVNGNVQWTGYGAWIDYNQDGVFDNLTENVLLSPGNGFSYTATFTVPCGAIPGNTVMRIIAEDYPIPIPGACNSPYYGEVEEYPVTILFSPITYTSSTTVQQPGIVAPGTADKPMLRIPVRTDGCGTAMATDFFFNTAGSTSAGDITSAKLYSTGNSPVFNTSRLLGTVSAPSGAFNFTVADTMVNNDTTNYWLAYDISASATLGNVVDATADSLTAVGGTHIPTVTNPAGSSQISAPMTYISSEAVQTRTDHVAQGSPDNDILKLMVVTSHTGAPITVSQLDLTAAGTTDTADIENISVYYTGNSSTFATTTQFGTTLPTLPGTVSFSVTGSPQFLTNDTNYFWLAYGIRSGATISNVVDGEFTSVTVGGSPQVPSVTAPAGSREIRQEYCSIAVLNPINACNAGYYINNITTTGAVTNLNNSTGCSPSANGVYYYSGSPLVINQAQTVSMTVNGNVQWTGYAAWIDYNQDGVYDNLTERVMQSPTNLLSYTANFAVPCGAIPGTTKMRVVAMDYPIPIPDACTYPYYGEIEEYPVTIVFTPLSYTASSALQQLGAVSAGTMDKPILRFPVRTDGCGVGVATELFFSTTGSTSAGDIASAKLYSTGTSNSFNTSKLLGTVSAPSGSFSFVVTDTLAPNDTTNYWLAYDISGSAVLNNVVDATADSITVDGITHTPIITTPPGNSEILNPMTLISSTVTQNSTSSVGVGTAGNNIIGIEVVTSATGAPIAFTSIDIATTGTTSLSDITNIQVWYTGTNSSFSLGTQFGSTVTSPAATQTVTGLTTLANGTNYFWVTYDVSASATLANLLDAECSSITVDGAPVTPTVTAPAGSRAIRADYCVPTQLGSPNIVNVTFNTLNYTSPAAVVPYYSNFAPSSSATTTVQRGGVYNLTVTIDNGGDAIGSVWIDYNDDGSLSASEWNQISTDMPSGSAYTIPVAIPLTSALGSLRMRIRTRAINNNNGAVDACSSFGSGETEDYTITIAPEPLPSTYVWNNASGGNFNTAANWTPNRNTIFLNDKLVFNLGGSINVSNVGSNVVKTLDVLNSTTVNLSNGSTSLFSVKDSISLGSGSRIYTGNNVTLAAGIDTNNVGGIYYTAGTSGVNGILKRWKNTALASVSFPMLSTAGITREINMSYTVAPVSGSITARFRNTAVSNTGLPLADGAITATKAAPDGFWSMTSTDGLSGGTYDVSLDATGFGFITDYLQTIVIYRTGTASAWSLNGTHTVTTGSNTTPVLHRSGITVYGQFGLGSDSSVNPLPVKLVKFTAANDKGNVNTTWITASELNNKGFEVQASIDAASFETVGFVKGAGNSNTSLSYTFVHEKAFRKYNATVLYYRLKQIDNDGKYSYSNAVKVTSNDLSQSLSVSPNPFTDKVNLRADMTEASSMKIAVVDLQGRTIMNESLTLTKGTNDIALDLAHLARGAYFVTTELNGEINTFKLIKSE